MKKLLLFVVIMVLMAGCIPGGTFISPGQGTGGNVLTPAPAGTQALTPPAPGAPSGGETQPSVSPSSTAKVPAFDHIVLIILENENFQKIIGNPKMPQINALARQNVLLTNYYAVTHPSLPNYIALVSGGTQGITSDCTDCYVNQPNLADLI